MLYGIFKGISYFLALFRYVLFTYCVLSWLLPPYHRVMKVLSRLTDPFLRPIRNAMYRLFPQARVDFSIFAAILAVGFVEHSLWWLYGMLAHF